MLILKKLKKLHKSALILIRFSLACLAGACVSIGFFLGIFWLDWHNGLLTVIENAAILICLITTGCFLHHCSDTVSDLY